MVTIQKFEDLLCWQESRKDAKSIYTVFQNCKDYAFRDQIQRASVSVMNNIAEWFSRFSSKEKIQFFNIAVASLNEVRSMIYLASDLKYIDQEIESGLLLENQTTKDVTYWFLKHLHNYKNSSTD